MDNINLISLSISYIFIITLNYNFLLFLGGESIKNFSSVERILVNVDSSLMEREDYTEDVNDSWPLGGEIVFENYSVRYRENLPLVLKNINL